MCRGLAASGAKVAVMGRRKEQAQEIADSITAAGGIAMPLPGDVTSKDSMEAAKAVLLAEWGTIDILVRPWARIAHRLSEKGVRLAQKMHVGPCIPVGIQL